MKYKVMKGYSKWDNTLRPEDIETVEYAAHIVPFEYFKDARAYLGYLAKRNDMVADAQNFKAEKVKEEIDEGTGIITIEREWLRIQNVV